MSTSGLMETVHLWIDGDLKRRGINSFLRAAIKQ
jgi:hypothetical protein